MELTIKLGNKIRLLRKKKGWTIEDLAFEADLNRNYIGDLERGLRNPTLKVLEKVAKAFEISIQELLADI